MPRILFCVGLATDGLRVNLMDVIEITSVGWDIYIRIGRTAFHWSRLFGAAIETAAPTPLVPK